MADSTAPNLVRVDIVHVRSLGLYDVTPIWSGVDVPDMHRVAVDHYPTAERVKNAMLAGVALVDPKVLTNVDGKTYVRPTTLIRGGRTLYADLRRLGF
ncbi:hypothetical protein [Prescottella equi]|uniref:hypothetical protein n=1 Tax=Rhodococcus hoagii TaxID=43767 RepID=UPI000D10258F|nr:hypothetical protein [Prescottella equi]AVP71318.1 hypothetical protein C7H75_24870 [Prescottella equi]